MDSPPINVRDLPDNAHEYFIKKCEQVEILFDCSNALEVTLLLNAISASLASFAVENTIDPTFFINDMFQATNRQAKEMQKSQSASS